MQILNCLFSPCCPPEERPEPRPAQPGTQPSQQMRVEAGHRNPLPPIHDHAPDFDRELFLTQTRAPVPSMQKKSALRDSNSGGREPPTGSTAKDSKVRTGAAMSIPLPKDAVAQARETLSSIPARTKVWVSRNGETGWEVNWVGLNQEKTEAIYTASDLGAPGGMKRGTGELWEYNIELRKPGLQFFLPASSGKGKPVIPPAQSVRDLKSAPLRRSEPPPVPVARAGVSSSSNKWAPLSGIKRGKPLELHIAKHKQPYQIRWESYEPQTQTATFTMATQEFGFAATPFLVPGLNLHGHLYGYVMKLYDGVEFKPVPPS